MVEIIDCEEGIKCLELYFELFLVLDVIFVVVFIFEFFICFSLVKNCWMFMKNFFNVIDLLVILLYYILFIVI